MAELHHSKILVLGGRLKKDVFVNVTCQAEGGMFFPGIGFVYEGEHMQIEFERFGYKMLGKHKLDFITICELHASGGIEEIAEHLLASCSNVKIRLTTSGIESEMSVKGSMAKLRSRDRIFPGNTMLSVDVFFENLVSESFML